MSFKSNQRKRKPRNNKRIKPKTDIFRKRSLLFHRGTIDRIDQILKAGKLVASEGKNGISLTEGITPIPGHGDTAIVFKKGFVGRLGFDATRVDYQNEDHIAKFRIIDENSHEKFQSQLIESHEWQMKHSQVYVDSLKTFEALGVHEELLRKIEQEKKQKFSKRQIEKNLVKQFSEWENEVFVDSKEIPIEDSEIVAIITPYRFYLDYFEGLSKYDDKCIFISDVIRMRSGGYVDVLGLQSPQAEDAIKRINHVKSKQQQGLFSHLTDYAIAAYHMACELIDYPEWYCELQNELINSRIINPPESLSNFLTQLVELPQNDFKSTFLDYIGNKRTRLSKQYMNQDLINNLDDLYVTELETRLSKGEKA